MTIGERITQARLMTHNIIDGKAMSQRELAKRAGLSQPQITRLESGHTQKSGKIIEIADALGVSVYWLKTGKGEVVPTIITHDDAINMLEEHKKGRAKFERFEKALIAMQLSDDDIEDVINYAIVYATKKI